MIPALISFAKWVDRLDKYLSPYHHAPGAVTDGCTKVMDNYQFGQHGK